MPGIRQLASELRRALTEFEPGRYSIAECGELARELGKAAKARETGAARAAARAAEGSGAGGPGDAADRLAKATGTSRTRAKAALDTLEKLEGCPATEEALLAGEVSAEQAAEIVAVPHHEAELLDLARRAGSGPVKRHARKRYQESLPAEELHQKRLEARELVSWEDTLGMIHLRGVLVPEVGRRLVNRLEAETDRLVRQTRRNANGGNSPTREQLTADAFARLLDPDQPAKRGGVEIVFVVDLHAWSRGHAHPGEVCHVAGGGPLPVSVVREHVSDAFVKVALHDGTQVDTIVHYGRKRPALLQSVLDLGAPPDFTGVECAEEGCHRRFGLQWDHVDPVANGGPTAADNLERRCWPCHHDKTERDRRAGKLRGKRPRGRPERGDRPPRGKQERGP